MTAGRKAYLVVSLVFIPLGFLGAIACFCPQPAPLTYMGLWMVLGFAWNRTRFLVAHVATGAAFVVTQIWVFSSGAGTAANFGKWLEHSRWMGLAAAAIIGVVAFGTAFLAERRKAALG